MDLEQYDFAVGSSSMVFEFVSEGVNGKIPKIIKYSRTSLNGFFNLGFGDKDLLSGDVNDLAVSNNGDTEKILATVVASLYFFTARYPDAWVYATGSTDTRTRLYRMGITKYLEEVEEDFDVFGLKGAQWHLFKKGQHYEAFLTKRKKISLYGNEGN